MTALVRLLACFLLVFTSPARPAEPEMKVAVAHPGNGVQ